MNQENLIVRRAEERGHFNFGWLDTYHTFSFGDYHDPEWMGFKTLRVINEDRVQPGEGFPTHSHRDMEIVTYILEGALQHKDSMGNTSVIRPGEVQRMSAGTGVTHSEYNSSKEGLVHLLQIWILPAEKNLKPGYEQTTFDTAGRQNKLRLVASPNGRDGSVTVHQDVNLFDCSLDTHSSLTYSVKNGRGIWLQIIRGKLDVNGHLLSASDGLAVSDGRELKITSKSPSDFLFFDLG